MRTISKTVIIIVLLISASVALTAQTPYSVQQIKDTIAKYDNIFVAYNKLDSGRIAANGYTVVYQYPSYDSIRSDTALKQMLLRLLDRNEYARYLLKNELDKFLIETRNAKFDSVAFVKNYLRRQYDIRSERQVAKIIDSIKVNNLFQVNFDLSLAHKLRNDSIYVDSYIKNYGFTKYINFLYPTQWKEVEKFVLDNCNVEQQSRYCNFVLIEMNEQNTVDKFIKYFSDKLSSGNFDYDDYSFINKITINEKFRIETGIIILKNPKEYFINPFEGYITDSAQSGLSLKQVICDDLSLFSNNTDLIDLKKFKLANDEYDYEKIIQYLSDL